MHRFTRDLERSFDRPKIAAVGEILWDLLPDGAQFGGAPANFAHHAAALGADVSMVSAVGDDSLGHQAIEILKAAGLDVSHVSICRDHPTGAVDVSIDGHGQPTYQFHPDNAWDHLPWSDRLLELAGQVDAVCFGTLGQRSEQSRQTIQQFLRATPESSLRVFDVNLRPPFYDDQQIDQSLKLANVLKLNDEELTQLCEMYDTDGSEIQRAQQLAERFRFRLVAVTRGQRGGLLVYGDEVSEVESQAVEIQDTVGAGDAFTAAVTLGMLQGVELDEINHAACRIAEYVCSQAGATPNVPSELRAALL